MRRSSSALTVVQLPPSVLINLLFSTKKYKHWSLEV